MMKKTFQHFTTLLVVSMGLLVVSCSYTHPSLRPKPSRKAVLKPQVTIHNHSDRDIVVGVDGPESRFVDIPAGSHRKLYLKSGAYKYAGSHRKLYLKSGAYKYAVAAEHISPVTGHKTFKPNHRYTWNFGLKQVHGVSF
jgi:hypothetical protein